MAAKVALRSIERATEFEMLAGTWGQESTSGVNGGG